MQMISLVQNLKYLTLSKNIPAKREKRKNQRKRAQKGKEKG